MRPLIILVTVLGFLFAACSSNEKSNQQVTVVPIVTETQVAASPTPAVATPVVTTCPKLTSTEEQLRDALRKQGDLKGETISLSFDGCRLIGSYTYEAANVYLEANPTVTDPTALPNNPDREIRAWLQDAGLPTDTIRHSAIRWTSHIDQSLEVCAILFPEDCNVDK